MPSMPEEKNKFETQLETQFETQVLGHLSALGTGITKLTTKMDMLISDDSETGMVPRLQADTKAVEKRVWYISGAALGIGGFIHWFVDAYRAVRGH